MEKLTVKNFLIIKHAEFDVGRMNFIIGPQASGKSVLAKLLYFFREFLQTDFEHSVGNLTSEEGLEVRCKERLKQLFSDEMWSEQEFELIYGVDDQAVRVSATRKGAFTLVCSPDLVSLRISAMEAFRERTSSLEATPESFDAAETLPFFWNRLLRESGLQGCFRRSLYIPAGRSFFAILEKNAFALNENVSIDHLLGSFAARLEFTKKQYEKSESRLRDEYTETQRKGMRLAESILKGSYIREYGKDWLLQGDTKVSLATTSSGQQEALPLLLTTIFWPRIYSFSQSSMSFVEEPEAHLFPVSQKTIVDLFALMYNKYSHSFVITTHSPYILTAANNLTLAKDVHHANPGLEIENMPDPDFHIAYEDVRAYTIEDGVLVSILDDESRLIGASVIDKVSDDLSEVFDSLLLQQIEM